MASLLTRNRSLPALITTLALVAGSLVIADAALADSAPANPNSATTPTTVTADGLPTPQINGVVWTQKIVGNTVYVGGEFSTARPAGVASKGPGTVKRSNMLAYDIRTGVLNTKFVPQINGDVRAIEVSADHRFLYVGGSFTKVSSVKRGRIAKISTSTGALVTSFKATADSQVSSLAIAKKSLFLGGAFAAVNGTPRSEVAQVTLAAGALTAWRPPVTGGPIRSMVLSASTKTLMIGGSFTRVNRSSRYAFGLAAISTQNGRTGVLPAEQTIRDGGPNAAITSLASDGTSVYGTGYVFHTSGNSKGNFEGTFRANWKTGKVEWVADCHGDVYSVALSSNAAYVAGHSRDCNTIGGFPTTKPITYHRAIAFSKAATQRVKDSSPTPTNPSFAGKPAPSLLNWYPELTPGTYTGLGQAAWSVAANSQYVLYGGEFTAVNGVPQQGLSRFAIRSLAPNKQGPKLAGATFRPSATPAGVGALRISFPANVDADNTSLRYDVYRDKDYSAPVFEATGSSSVWMRPGIGFVDRGLTPGTQYSYRVRATDAFGNTALGDPIFVTAPTTATGSYEQTVVAQKATHFWRFDSATGAAVNDHAGNVPLVPRKGITGGTPGSSTDGTSASMFSGAATSFAETPTLVSPPGTLSVSAWFKSTSKVGGKLVDYHVARDGATPSTDRALSLTTTGRASFRMIVANKAVSITTRGVVTDGRWHQVVGTTTTTGMRFYLDGKLVGAAKGKIAPRQLVGTWRVGADPTASKERSYVGAIDDVSTYGTELTPAQVTAQWRAAHGLAAQS